MEDKNVIWPGWEIVKRIGSGSFGAVYEIQRDVFGEIEKAALKVISIPQQRDEIDEFRVQGYDDASITKHFQGYLQDIVAEYSLMAKMKGHTNVVYCDDVRYIQHDDGIGWDIYIKMELLTPLMKALDRVTDEKQVIRLGEDICNALVLCKERNIVHRDIKPQNIFVSDDGNFKLGDFGIAKTIERTSGGTKVGTYKYMAPEVYNNQPYGLASDIYALGLVMYWLLNERRTPFLPLPPHIPTASMEEDARCRRFRGEQFPPPANGSQGLKRIVMKACAFDVNHRYATANEMLEDLRSLQRGAVSPTSTDVMAVVNAPADYAGNDATEYAGNDATEYAGSDATEYAGNDATEYIGSNIAMPVGNRVQQYADCDKTEYSGSVQPVPVVPADKKKSEVKQAKEATHEPKAAVEEPLKKGNKKKKLLFVLILVFFVLAGGILAFYFFGDDTEQTLGGKQNQTENSFESTDQTQPEANVVVNVVGMYEQDAQMLLERLGFEVTVIQSYSDTVEEGQVISQDPAGETEADPGATVTINVSIGKEVIQHQVPDLVGKSEAEAREALEELNFLVEVSYVADSSVSEGSVVSQSVPQNTELTEGSLIIIEVSSGRPTVEVADAVGKTEADAKQMLEEQGFLVEVTEEYSATVPAGSVIAQSPQASSSQIMGSTITITVSKGKQAVSVTLNANGGSVETSTLTVYFDDTYKTLPVPTQKGYYFLGWFTAMNGGTQVTSETKVTNAADHTLYARWSADGYSVNFNANGGSTSVSSKTVTFGSTYGKLPTPTRDYHNFLGWYTAASGGTKVSESTTVNITGSQTLYAHWEQKPLSGWVLASSVPADAQVVNRKWTYTKTETKTSTSTSMPGWTQVGSSWQQTGTGTYYWCAFPSTFNKNDALYTKYYGTGAKMTASETATSKRTVTESKVHTYVYWHWVHNWGNHNSYDRLISDTYNYKLSNGKRAETWEAFESTTAKNKNTSANAYWFAYSANNHSHWWLRQTVYKQTYTDYEKLFTYQKVTDGLESTTKVTESAGISNVKEYVQYREK